MKRFLLVFLLILILSSSFSFADFGPKPSVTIHFEDVPSSEGVYYVTLLSKTNSTGPFSASKEKDALGEIEQKFQSYKDDFYFLQYYQEVPNKLFQWNYYPPHTFKVLAYFPKSDTFYVSDVMKRKNFHSVFTVSFGKDKLFSNKYPDPAPIFTKDFFFSVLITLVVEILIAALFRFGKKHFLSFVAVVNILTQLLLYYGVLRVLSGWKPLPALMIMEAAVLLIECAAYIIFTRKPKRAIAYALLANTASFVIGMILRA